MKRTYLAALAAGVTLAAAVPAAWAGVETGPKVALHVTAPAAKASFICSTSDPVHLAIPCANFVTEGAITTDLMVYMVVADADTPSFNDGVGGVNLGLEYNGNTGQGVDVTTWTLCADGQQYVNAGPRGDWPAAGGGNVITWFTCQTTRLGSDGIHAVIGALDVYAYGDDKLRLTPNRTQQGGPVFALANCSAQEIAGLDTLKVLGSAGFGTKLGCNPCTSVIGCPVPVLPTTWGKIKGLYNR